MLMVKAILSAYSRKNDKLKVVCYEKYITFRKVDLIVTDLANARTCILEISK